MAKKAKQNKLIIEMFQALSDCKAGRLVLTDEKEEKSLLFDFEREPEKPKWVSAKEAMAYHDIKNTRTLERKRKTGIIKSRPFGAGRYKYLIND